MSSSIRPPSASSPGPSGVSELSAPKPAALEAGKAAGKVAESDAQAASAASPAAHWLTRLSAGEVTKQQAIDGLVEQALAAQGTARLSAAQRAELSEVLRESLLGDPVLGRLLAGE